MSIAEPARTVSTRESRQARFSRAKHLATTWAQRAYGHLIARRFGGLLADWPDSPSREEAEERSIRDMERICDGVSSFAAQLYVDGGRKRDPLEDTCLADSLRDQIEVDVQRFEAGEPDDVQLIDEEIDVEIDTEAVSLPLNLTVSVAAVDFDGDVDCSLVSIDRDKSLATYRLSIVG